MFDQNNRVNGTKAYTYGIDAKGKMYIYDKGSDQMVFYGSPDKGFSRVANIEMRGNPMTFEGDATQKASVAPKASSNTAVSGFGTGTGVGASTPVLDQDQLASLDALLAGYDTTRSTARKKAGLTRDASLNEKKDERKRETGKYESGKLTNLQDFAGAKTDTDINTRNTLDNLVSSMSVLGLGGGRELRRQILDASNRSNRQANATQAKTAQGLDSAFNEYTAGYESDIDKINDQYDYDIGEADRQWGQNRQNTLYKKADVYNAADRGSERSKLMKEGDSLNSFIGNAAFVNPRYTGQARSIATPEVADYTQDIAQYDTTAIGMDGMTPAGTPGAGNMAVRAVALNDRDFGIKKKTEGELGFGV